MRQVTATTTFLSKSNIKTAVFNVSRILSRSQQHKFELTGNIEYSDRENLINQTLIETSSRRIASLSLGLNYTKYFPASTLIASPSIEQGVPWFGGIGDSPGITKDDPHAEYTLYKLYIYFRTQLTEGALPISFQTNLNVQQSSDALFGEKQIVLGGEYSIRGYKENILSSDNGWTLRNDLIYPIARLTENPQQNTWLVPFKARLFLDLGHGSSAGSGESESLSGWGVGLDYQYRSFNLSINYAKSLDDSPLFTSDEGWVNYINASIHYTF